MRVGRFTPNGVIGASGEWYPCGIRGHEQCAVDHRDDGPVVVVRTHFWDSSAEFAAYYTEEKSTPTQAQFETLMDWCESTGNTFEYVTDVWDSPWKKWRDE